MALEVKKGNTAVRWGTENLISGYGYVQSCKTSKDGKEVEVMREDGEVVSHISYDDRTSITLEVVYVTGQTLPTRGDLISITGLITLTNAVVKNVEINYTNTDVTKVTITATKYPLF